MYRNKQLTREQAQQEYRNYCDIQPQGTTPISFNEFLSNFKITIIL